jgi:hypothetical protein
MKLGEVEELLRRIFSLTFVPRLQGCTLCWTWRRAATTNTARGEERLWFSRDTQKLQWRIIGGPFQSLVAGEDGREGERTDLGAGIAHRKIRNHFF